jgi:transcriptional regulator with XRE-family HTH domain
MAKKIHDRLISVREALKITQKDFCKGIYMSQSYYAQVEGGKRPVNDRLIALVCSQYGVSKDYLLTGKGKMFSEKLADIQLQQLTDIFYELEPPFREYILLQIKQLAEAQKKQKGDSPPKSKESSPD